MEREIRFCAVNMKGKTEYGFLTKKRLRNSGEIVWAIAHGDCSGSKTVPVREGSIQQFCGWSSGSYAREIYEGDTYSDETGTYVATLKFVWEKVVDKHETID